jgi:hypothetical protein
MSIFEMKEWWATKVGNNEEFDSCHIALGNVDNTVPSETKIVVGKSILNISII